MPRPRNPQRPPRSLRKQIRGLKSRLRRELGRDDAVQAIERELRGLRRRSV